MQLQDGNWQRVDRADVPTQAPAPVDAGLLRAVSQAYIDAYANTLMTFGEKHIKCMTAALRVAADALLGPVTDEELSPYALLIENDNGQKGWFIDPDQVRELVAARRARLLAPAKTVDERIRVTHAAGLAAIYLDGELQVRFGDEDASIRERNAYRYRLGLIATLKQEGVA